MVHGISNPGKKIVEPAYFGTSLQSFDDCLFGGFGLQNPCRIIWENIEYSRENLGFIVYADWCRSQISNKEFLDQEGLDYLMSEEKKARAGKGSTMFEILVDMIKSVESRSNGECIIHLVCA